MARRQGIAPPVAVPAAATAAAAVAESAAPDERFVEDEGYFSQDPQECVPAVAMEGAEEDEMLSRSMVMTRAEVVKRRRRRVRQLIKLYRVQYWALLEELRAKYRRFYLRTGKSGWREENEAEESQQPGNVDMRVPERSAGEAIKCGFQGCMTKPMPLSAYCFDHILLEPRQCLYKPCAFVPRSAPNGTCGKPVLRAVVPSFCAIHFQLAQRQAARVMKRAANNNTVPPLGAFAGKGAPKLHVLISEYVRAIQNKRRARAANHS
ncbi:INO80 complex subunit D [Selaginella moellendorffii]|nr:INO80 complex subunit D [Selaginella moellendorffii]XP_024533747.1 INO80 complex subunit D [Selaginella moellendorffii]|eukprot:XP_002988052.2 INO80 complex subunit D [Selaginella moellendorffii]